MGGSCSLNLCRQNRWHVESGETGKSSLTLIVKTVRKYLKKKDPDLLSVRLVQTAGVLGCSAYIWKKELYQRPKGEAPGKGLLEIAALAMAVSYFVGSLEALYQQNHALMVYEAMEKIRRNRRGNLDKRSVLP